MNISAKTEYACLALLELASRAGSGEPVRIREIAEKHEIPSRFLVQILLQLKGAGLVSSTRGASGGYQLVGPPSEISLGDVFTAVDGAAAANESLTNSRYAGVLHKVWTLLASRHHQLLCGITLADLLEQSADKTSNMYYI